MVNNHNDITKEQAYLAYTTYNEVFGSPVVGFDDFSQIQYDAWRKVSGVFWSFWSTPECSDQAAA